MELGKNATNELYSCSKWPFWQANIKIHLILVYWDARNSLFYKLVIPFKDSVTFVVTTAIQSLQRWYLENVADVTFVSMYHFWNRFLNFWIENAHTSGPKAIVPKEGPKHGSTTPKTTKNHKSLNFWIENAYSSGCPEAIGGPKRSKRRSKTQFLGQPKTT